MVRVHPFDLPVSPGMFHLRWAVLDAIFAAAHVKHVCHPRKAEAEVRPVFLTVAWLARPKSENARDRASTALERLRDTRAARLTIEPGKIERFSTIMRETLTNGTISFRKASLRAVIERIEVDDATVRIIGDKSELEQVITARSE